MHLDPQSPWASPGIAGCKALVSAYRGVFANIHFSVKEQVQAGDTVVCHWSGSGTHAGELMGIAPTGRPIETQGISILQLRGGKICRQTIVWDALTILQQIGAVPSMGQATT